MVCVENSVEAFPSASHLGALLVVLWYIQKSAAGPDVWLGCFALLKWDSSCEAQ